MAIIKNNFLVGVLGSLIFKVVNGEQVVTTKKQKGTTKQSVATVAVSKTYGLASKFASEMMQSHEQNLNKMQDGSMFSRLTPLLFKKLDEAWDPARQRFEVGRMDFTSMAGFAYNIKSALHKNMNANTIVKLTSGRLQITFDQGPLKTPIKFPRGATSCELTVAIVLFRLEDGLKTKVVISQDQWIYRHQDEIELESFQFEVPQGCLCMVSTFLHFYAYRKNYLISMNTKNFNPAAIAAVLFIQESEVPLNKYKWVKMPGLKFS